jgi:hypothetical protein
MGFRGSCLVSLSLGSKANAVIAGKPAPTEFVWYHNPAFTSAPCGRGSCLVSQSLGSEANAVIAGKPAPTEFVWYHNPAITSAPCGRGSCLVSQSLGSEANAVIAGKPAPTEFVWYHNLAFTSAPCGSGLARDGARADTDYSDSKILGDFLQVVAVLVNLFWPKLRASLALSLNNR